VRVRAYIRVSTDEQAEEGFSLPTQRQRVSDFCRSQWGLDPELIWYTDDGYSAKDTDRPAMRALRHEAAPGDVVIVLRLDRLTRSVLDLYTLLKEWEERSIFFRSVTEPYDTQKAEGRFMIGLLALLAEWERLRISERVREVMAHTVRADRRHLSRAPLGYDLVQGRLIVNQAEGAIAREIFARYLSGAGLRQVALDLNRRGVRTKQHAVWTAFTIAYVLRNPIYVGQVSWQRISIRGKRRRQESSPVDVIVAAGEHQPLITTQTWDAVQAKLGAHRRAPPRASSSPYPLTGILKCGLCGGPLHGVTQRRYRAGQVEEGSERQYYRCSRRVHLKACTLPYLRAPDLERTVLAALPPLAPKERCEAIATRLAPAPGANPLQEQRDALQAELRRCDRAKHRWNDAYAAADITAAEWRERLAAVGARQGAITERLGALPPEQLRAPDPQEIARAMLDLPAIWHTLAPFERRELIHGLIQTVHVQSDGLVRIELRTRP
jgi:site-specific DNA recombinase